MTSFIWDCKNVSENDKGYITELLPTTNNYKVLSVSKNTSKFNDNEFTGYLLRIKTNLVNEAEARQWLKDFELINSIHYTTYATRPTSGVFVKWKCYFKCCFNTRNVKTKSAATPNVRNIKCPSKIIFTIYPCSKCDSAVYTCEIDLKYTHNHHLKSSDTTRFLPMLEDTKCKLLELFYKGYNPITALEAHRLDLELQNPENYEELLADGRYCPNIPAIYRLYKTEFGTQSNSKHDIDPNEFLLQSIQELNADYGSECIKITIVDGEKIICIVTPLMKRVHESVQQSSEWAFLDSSGTGDKEGHRVFIILTYNESGGVPLGALITKSESEKVLTAGMLLFKEIIGDKGFYGFIGPKIWMIDDNICQRNVLSAVWPNSQCLLFIFHVLQAFWKWLLKSTSSLHVADRQEIYADFKKILYSNTEDEYHFNYNIFMKKVTEKYPTVSKHIGSSWIRKPEWAICYRNNLLIRGNHGSNYSEASMRILKDHVLRRLKSFNVVQLVHIIATNMSKYYEKRILDEVYSKPRMDKKHKFAKPPSHVIWNTLPMSNNLFEVPNDDGDVKFIVDNDINICSCSKGNTGKMCKHQYWIDVLFNQRPALKFSVRKEMYYIAKGYLPEDGPNLLQTLSGATPKKSVVETIASVASAEYDYNDDDGHDYADDPSAMEIDPSSTPIDAAPEDIPEAEVPKVQEEIRESKPAIETEVPPIKLRTKKEYIKASKAALKDIHEVLDKHIKLSPETMVHALVEMAHHIKSCKNTTSVEASLRNISIGVNDNPTNTSQNANSPFEYYYMNNQHLG